MSERNLVWDNQMISTQSRQARLKQKGCVIWFSGLSGSGKSTIAGKVEEKLYQQGLIPYRIDGDNVRHGLCSDLGFSAEDRFENIRRVSEVCKLMADAQLIVLATFVSPDENIRGVSKTILNDLVHLVYVKADIKTCIQRDPKGLYKKALNHEIKDFTGISQRFEEPQNPDCILDTDAYSVQECVQKCFEYIMSVQK